MRIIRDHERKYNLELACLCGLREAVIADLIRNMTFCGAEIKVVNNRTWVKCTQRTLIEKLPFLTEEAVRRSVNVLESKGILRVDILGEDKFDRTYWYAFTDFGSDLMNGKGRKPDEGIA